MKLDIDKLEVVRKERFQPYNWAINAQPLPLEEKLQPSTWVKLLELPSPLSFDEALLLCQCSESEWLAWIPDHGEAVLHTRQFCLTP